MEAHGQIRKLVLRLGAFHITDTLLAVIGKRFQDAGLKDLGIEVGIITKGSIAAMFHEYLDLLRT